MNNQRCRTLLAAGLALVATGAVALGRVRAQDKQEAKDGLSDLASRVQEIVLPNGLKILVLERHAAPVVAFAT